MLGLGTKFHKECGIVTLPQGHNIYVERIVRPGIPEGQTIVLVNGALATLRTYKWAHSLLDRFNLLLYDLPHAGQSKQHNDRRRIISRQDEADILLHLIERYRPRFLGSTSWGGSAALMALAERPASVEKAIICSFSDRISPPMAQLLERQEKYIATRQRQAGYELLNETLGRYLPPLTKRVNLAYFLSLDDHEIEQIHAHLRSVVAAAAGLHKASLARIGAEILFVNGELDEYTTVADAQRLSGQLRRSRAIAVAGAGHMLTAESREIALRITEIANGFFSQNVPEPA